MNKLWITLGVLAFFGIMLYSSVTGRYNQMVTLGQETDKSWSKVESQYQRRFDLIPNLVSSVKGYMNHETEVFGAIAEARTHYANANTSGTTDDKVEATQQYEGALARLMVVMENYPVLTSQQNITALMDELAGTENRVTVARNDYNDVATVYNIDIKKFPMNLFANFFGFKEKVLFKANVEATNAPTVNL